jgi:hypothetical protein
MKLIVKYIPGIITFLICLIISINSYKNYGIGWDESTQREIGQVSYKYVFEGNDSLFQYYGRYHGVGFEVPFIMLEKKLGLQDTRDIYLMRHIVNNVFFLVCAFFFYMLVLRVYKKWWLAVLGFLMLVYHPRIYMHSFLNTKDVPFLGMFAVSMLVAHIAFNKERYRSLWFVLLAICCAYATSIRILGILLFVSLAAFLLIDIVLDIYHKRKMKGKPVALLSFIVVYCITLLAMWPFLWPSPFLHFVEAFQAFSIYGWGGKVLFAGASYPSTALPWNYLPAWFCISMPIFWLALGFVGGVWAIILFIKNPLAYFDNTEKRNRIWYFAMFIIPFIMVIAFHSVVYDDWRHVYFTYPCFIMLALFVVDSIPWRIFRYVIVALCCVQVFLNARFIYKAHPLEYVYFNMLVSKEKESLRHNYELDYWGVGFRAALEYVLSVEDPYHTIIIPAPMDPIYTNSFILPKKERERIHFSQSDTDAHYILTNYRYHPEDYPYKNEVYTRSLMNSKVLSVFKIEDSTDIK